MYTVKEIAQKTNTPQATVRYFARLHHIQKVACGNKAVFVFSKKDLKRFLAFKNNTVKKEDEKQLVFSFYCRQEKKKKKRKETVLPEEETIKKMCTFLKDAKANGIQKTTLCKQLHIQEKDLNRILIKCRDLPIGEDEAIDDRLYWVG